MENNNMVALVTGSSRGIGRSIVLELAKKGYNVVINYNSSQIEASSLVDELVKYDVKYMVIKCDISKEEEVKDMVDDVISNFGKIDILVNNAGIAIDTLYDDKLVDNFKKIIDVNLIGTFLVSKCVGNYMLKEKKGKIINIASTNGIDTYYPESLDYDASKAGVISLTHNMAKQYAPYINVNAICPGWINTDMNKELDLKFIKNECKKILLNRFGNPLEVASLVCFLASDEANYINNTIIRIDGGKNE